MISKQTAGKLLSKNSAVCIASSLFGPSFGGPENEYRAEVLSNLLVDRDLAILPRYICDHLEYPNGAIDEGSKLPAFIQLIPYVYLKYNGKILTYSRGSKSGDERLVGNRSVGFGGHIDLSDTVSNVDGQQLKTIDQVVRQACIREFTEELKIEDTTVCDYIHDLMTEDDMSDCILFHGNNAVSDVHAMVVIEVDLSGLTQTAVDSIVGNEELVIEDLKWESVQELKESKWENYELWSQIVLKDVQ